MRKTTLALLSATLLATGATFAGAQDRMGTDRTQQGYGQLPGGPTFGDATQAQVPRSEQRAALRRQLRQEGFRDIQISDAVFFVQALTPDGRIVMMAVSPEPDALAQRDGAGDQDRMARGEDVFQDWRGDRQPGMQGFDGDMQAMQDRGEQMARERQAMQERAQRIQQQRQAMRGQDQADQDREATGTIPGPMDEEEIRSRLQERGFSDIRNWEREDTVYTATADWYGEEVDVRVDARSGALIEPVRLEETQVENLLAEQGFEDVREVRTEEGRYRARADRDGTTYTLEVDPRTGRILGREEREG